MASSDSEPESWPVVSVRAQELIRQGALTVLQQGGKFVENFRTIALSGDSTRPIALDPVLAENSRRTTLANVLHWATANVERPGARRLYRGSGRRAPRPSARLSRRPCHR